MKDLIIGTSTNYDWSKLKYWVNSINASGFEGDKVLVLLNCDKETVKKVIDAGFIVVAGQKDSEGNLVHQSAIPVHVERFLFMHNFLTTRDYRYIVTTDVKDVVFQRNPIEYIEKNLHEDKADEIPHRCAGSLLPSARTAGVERQTNESHRPVGALAQRAAASTKNRT